MPAESSPPAVPPRSLRDRLGGLVRRRIPTTAVGMGRAIALVVAGIRLGTIVQMAPSMTTGVAISPRPGLYLASWVAAAAASVAISLRVLLRDRGLGRRVFVADVALAVALLLLGDLCVPTEHRIGTWVGFQPGYALAVLLNGALVPGLGLWLAGLASITAADLVFRWPQATDANASTIIGNSLTYVVLVSVARVAGRYMHRVAADGDAARAAAAELARREEERRAQVAFHNGAALMRLLAAPDLDEEARRALQREADREARRMRSYLQGHQPDLDDDAGSRSLVGVVGGTVARFSDLPVHTALDLAEGVPLAPDVAGAVDHALAAVLLNVRDHAAAERVVVHADVEEAGDGPPEGERWVVTVHDDGRGFDPDPRRWGVGLREVVDRQLRELGVEVDIASVPGRGSTVVLRGLAVVPGESERVR